MDDNTRRLAEFLLSDDARMRRQRQNLALSGYDTSGYQPTFGPGDSNPEQAGPEVGPMRRSPVNPIVAGPDQASFLTSEKDTRPHWETDQRAMLMPLVMSGYNNSVSYGVPSILGGHAWSTMGDIVKGNAVHPDEIAHSANDAAGAAMLGSMPMSAPRGAIRPGAARTTPETGIRAYHGSPHDFDRFDMSKIGTGEGAQAFGHGLYFAENEGVAKYYRDALSTGPLGPFYSKAAVGGKAFDPEDPLHVAAGAIYDYGRLQAPFKFAADVSRSPDDQVAAEALKLLRSKSLLTIPKLEPEAISRGKMYEVNIKADPNDFLDWDKPLSQQSEKVRGALANFGQTPQDFDIAIEALRAKRQNPIVRNGDSSEYIKAIDNRIADLEATKQTYDVPAGQFIQRLEYGKNDTKNQQAASSRLREAGIPGIKYLDQGSRGAGEGSRNYVVFDDKLVEILRKYGLAGILAGGYAMTGQEPQE